MNASERRQRFRLILAGGDCVHPASVFDPMSARMAESLGFDLGIFSGSVASALILGSPDLVLHTLSEFSEQARRITRASDISLLVDADHGFGNALGVMRTVEELEAAGVSALTIEDTALPRPFGEASEGLIPVPEMVGKLRAAVNARQDPSLVIVGRTGALRHLGAQEAASRARAYEACGVDAVFLVGARVGADVEAVHEATSLPLIMGGSPASLGDKATLAASGVRVALQSHVPFYAGAQAVYDTLKALKGGVSPDDLQSRALSKELMALSLRTNRYSEWESEFLG